jgi:hypothetical protein
LLVAIGGGIAAIKVFHVEWEYGVAAFHYLPFLLKCTIVWGEKLRGIVDIFLLIVNGLIDNTQKKMSQKCPILVISR